MKDTEQQARKLADHLAARRDAILENWRHLVKTDPGLTSASTLLRTEFYDHIPGVLDAFERKLCARQSSAAAGRKMSRRNVRPNTACTAGTTATTNKT